MYRNPSTLYNFLSALKQRLSGHFFAYLLTIDFAKKDERTYSKRFYTLKNALNYIHSHDPNAIMLAREERYSDGHGVHVHAIIITSSYVNFKQFHKYAQSHSLTYANFNIKYVQTNMESILKVISYVVKNQGEVYRAWKTINAPSFKNL